YIVAGRVGTLPALRLVVASRSCSCSGVEAGAGGTVAGGLCAAGAGVAAGVGVMGSCPNATADMIIAIELALRTKLARRLMGEFCMNIGNLPCRIKKSGAKR